MTYKSIVFLFIFIASLCAAPKAEVYILGGQSNMQGVGALTDLSADDTAPAKDIFFWNGKTFIALIPGITKTSLGAKFGPEIGFAKTLRKYKINTPIYIIKFFKSGKPLHHGWNNEKWLGGKPSPNRLNFYPGLNRKDINMGGFYRQGIKKVEAALKSLKAKKVNFAVRGLVWMQGEADAKNGTSAKEYAACLKLLKKRLEEDTDSKNLPFVYGQVLPYSPALKRFTHRELLRQNQKLADCRSKSAKSIANAFMVSTDNFPLNNDKVHYNAEGQLKLGTAFAVMLLKAQKASK